MQSNIDIAWKHDGCTLRFHWASLHPFSWLPHRGDSIALRPTSAVCSPFSLLSCQSVAEMSSHGSAVWTMSLVLPKTRTDVSLTSVTELLCCFRRESESKPTDEHGTEGRRIFKYTFPIWETLLVMCSGQLNSALGQAGKRKICLQLTAISRKRKIHWGINLWGDKRWY